MDLGCMNMKLQARIILFGSYARGDYVEESDVDLMIVLDCNADEVKKLRGITAKMASDISLKYGIFLSVLLRDKKQFEDNLDFLPFYRNIAREGVAIYGCKTKGFMLLSLAKSKKMFRLSQSFRTIRRLLWCSKPILLCDIS